VDIGLLNCSDIRKAAGLWCDFDLESCLIKKFLCQEAFASYVKNEGYSGPAGSTYPVRDFTFRKTYRDGTLCHKCQAVLIPKVTDVLIFVKIQTQSGKDVLKGHPIFHWPGA